MFGTNEVHFVQSHLDWSLKTDELPGPPYDRRYALRQMYQLAERFKDVPYVIISADYNVNQLWHFTPLAKVGFAVANRKQGLLNNVLVKGFDVKETFYADEGHTLSDHQIFGCVLEMHDSDWVEETGGTQGLTGAWAREVGYDMKTLKANLANNIFTPDSPSEGNYVTMDLTTMMCAPAADYEQPAPDAAVQAAVRLSKDLRFQVWTKKQLGVVSGGVGESGWLDVAAEGVVPADDTEYTFRFVFDYARGKYSVSTMGKRGEYRSPHKPAPYPESDSRARRCSSRSSDCGSGACPGDFGCQSGKEADDFINERKNNENNDNDEEGVAQGHRIRSGSRRKRNASVGGT